MSAIKADRFCPATDRNILSAVFTWCRCQQWVINFSEPLRRPWSCSPRRPVDSLTAAGWASHWAFACFQIYAQQPFLVAVCVCVCACVDVDRNITRTWEGEKFTIPPGNAASIYKVTSSLILCTNNSNCVQLVCFFAVGWNQMQTNLLKVKARLMNSVNSESVDPPVICDQVNDRWTPLEWKAEWAL